MRRKILLTTLGNTIDHSRHLYFSYVCNTIPQYCDGIGTAEAGAKYILSKTPIDKVIVLGPPSAGEARYFNKDIKLRDLCIFNADLPEEYSEFKFFCYRIMQFLNQVDIEGNDLLDVLMPEDKASFLKVLDEYLKEHPESVFDPEEKYNGLFDYFNSRQEDFLVLSENAAEYDTAKEKALKHYLYMLLDKSYKMSSISANENIEVQFVPTLLEDKENSDRLGNLPKILEAVIADQTEIDIYVDLQGMDIPDSNALLNILFMLQNAKMWDFTIQEIISTSYQPLLFTNPIEDQKKRLELGDLLSGIDAFLQYGKVGSLRRYWMSRNIKDEHIEKLIYAMQRVDIGISLCSESEIEQGIQMLQLVFSSPSKPSAVLESMIFNLLEYGIRYDYGKLIRGDEIDILALTKWAMKKQFYQQALTIIESRVPYDLVRSGVFYYARNEREKQDFLARMCEIFWSIPPKDRYVFDNLNHYYIKFYRRTGFKRRGRKTLLETYVDMRLDEVYDPDCPYHSFTRYNGKRGRMGEFLLAYLEIGNIRNQISHAQEFDISLEHWDLNEENEKVHLLEQSIASFVTMYEKIRSGIKKADVDSLVVSQVEFKEYVNAHKPE